MIPIVRVPEDRSDVLFVSDIAVGDDTVAVEPSIVVVIVANVVVGTGGGLVVVISVVSGSSDDIKIAS